MKGKDLVNYILRHKLDEAEIDIGISDPLQFVVTIPSVDGICRSGEKELVYDFTRDFVYEKYLSATPISYEEAEKIRDLDIDKALEHGRLIDADELIGVIKKKCAGMCSDCDYASQDCNCNLILNAPTIIEAKRGKEDGNG